jgi:CubicO group peptidase (beta-lactamase class C family)
MHRAIHSPFGTWQRIFDHLRWALLVVCLVEFVGAADGGISPDRIREMAESARAQGEVPGISLAVVSNGKIVWSGGVGFADAEQNVPATGQTVYRIGSISKPIAATAVMQFVEAGKVHLEDPIQNYAPQFPRHEDSSLTIEHLLSHTGGVRHYRGTEFYSPKRYNSLNDAIRVFQDDQLLFSPGDRYSYSSYGYNLVSAVVEMGGGMPFDQYLSEQIFKPANMTSARCERAEELVPHRSRYYFRDKAGKLHNSPYVDLSVKWAGGGIIASAEDLANFDLALNRGELLEPSTQERMTQPGRLNDGSLTSYGLGWRLSQATDGTPLIGHSGGSVGATTQFLRCPQEQLAVVVLANLQGTDAPRILALQLMDLMLADEAAPSP